MTGDAQNKGRGFATVPLLKELPGSVPGSVQTRASGRLAERGSGPHVDADALQDSAFVFKLF